MGIETNLNWFTWLDAIALGLLWFGWFGIGWWIDTTHEKRPSVTSVMKNYRREWMHQMVTRDPRIFDSQVMASLRQGTSFFASTNILAIGGVLALMGNTAPLQGVAADISGMPSPALVWQAKLVAVCAFLAMAFLKFVWANRLFGYCSVIMAAVPNDISDPATYPRAAQAAEMNIRAAINFNRGLRAMYFALAATVWLIGAIALIIAVLTTIWILWSREFASLPREILLSEDAPTQK